MISGRENPISGLRRAFVSRKAGARGNPLEREEAEEREEGKETEQREGDLES